jgi:hypothetical protein
MGAVILNAKRIARRDAAFVKMAEALQTALSYHDGISERAEMPHVLRNSSVPSCLLDEGYSSPAHRGRHARVRATAMRRE